MAKPGTVPQWDSNGTNAVEPAAGYKTDGWTNGEDVDSSFFNWFMMWVYAWIAWLNGLFGSDGTYTPDAGAHIVLSGAGKYKRGVKARHYMPACGRASAGTFPTAGVGTSYYVGNWVPNANGDTLGVALDGLQEGERITRVEIEVVANSVAVFECHLTTSAMSGAGEVATVATSASSTAAFAVETVVLTPGGGGLAVSSGHCNYMLTMYVDGAIAADATAMQVGNITVYTDVP